MEHLSVEQAWDAANGNVAKLHDLSIATIMKATEEHPTANRIFMNTAGMSDFQSRAEQLSNLYDPINKYEVVLKGKLGVLLGLDVHTDGYCDPDKRFLRGNYIAWE